MTFSQLISRIETNLTRVGNNRITGPEIKEVALAIANYFATQNTEAIPDWNDALEFNANGTGAGSICKFPDATGKKRIFESKTDGNIGNEPPSSPAETENTHWREVSPSPASAIQEHAAGLYGAGLVIVVHNHSVDGRGFYWLLEPERPFVSADIEAEILEGKWERIGGINGGGGSQNLDQVLIIGNDAGAKQIKNLADPTDAQDADTRAARDAAIAAAIATLINSAPGFLDQFNEIAAALGNDPDFATTMLNALALKAPLNSPALSGSPSSPTAARGTNTTQLATTAFVQQELDEEVVDLGTVSSGTVTLDLARKNFRIILTGNITLSWSGTPKPGKEYKVWIERATNTTITWAANKWKAPLGQAPILTNPTANGSDPAKTIDILSFTCRGVDNRPTVVITPDSQNI